MNRLHNEDSPYLIQHSHNPVDWYPWGEEALSRAKKEKKPIFVSIGYSSCHWCHVMEKESFENQEIAAMLNAHFISIKVDKEERIDIDVYFQGIYQLLNRRAGGWPLSIFLTHEQKPFFAGTYIPIVKMGRNMAFGELLGLVVTQYQSNYTEIARNGGEIEMYAKKATMQTGSVDFDKTYLSDFIHDVQFSFDSHYGGFSQAPKFPHTSTIQSVMDVYKLTQNAELLHIATHTLDNMVKGGFYDLVDGGFCRYSTDEEWLVPHFEKMTHDNGLLAELYIKAYHLTQKPIYKKIAIDTIEFMLKKMYENGLFFSASDADSDGVEGGYFEFSAEELGGLPHRDSLLRVEDVRDIASLDTRKLRVIREGRTYPFIDKKTQTSWGAMMIKALFVASTLDERYLGIATQSLSALTTLMWHDGRLYHSTIGGKMPKIEGFLEDYAYLIDCYLEGYAMTLDDMYLNFGQTLAHEALKVFYQEGSWLSSWGEFVVQGEPSDTSYPSSVALMTNNLLTLGVLLEEEKYGRFAIKTIERYSKKIAQYPAHHALFSSAIFRTLYDDRVIKGEADVLKQNGKTRFTFRHPFVLYKGLKQDGFEVCGTRSCYAHYKDFKEIVL